MHEYIAFLIYMWIIFIFVRAIIIFKNEDIIVLIILLILVNVYFKHLPKRLLGTLNQSMTHSDIWSP